MQDYGFIRVAAAVPKMKVADTKANTENICQLIDLAEQKEVSLLVFPELSITGYTCGDLFCQNLLIREAEASVERVCRHCSSKDITVVVGSPVRVHGRLYNCGVVISAGEVKGIVPKLHIPNSIEFYEARNFTAGSGFLGCPTKVKYAGFETDISPNIIFNMEGVNFAIEICEDLWTPIPPSSQHCLAGAHIIANLSASNELVDKQRYRHDLVTQQSARTCSAYIYCSAGYGESTQDLVFAGSSFIAENGNILVENERFKTENSLIITDIDIQKLDAVRSKASTYDAVSPDGTPSADYAKYYIFADGCRKANTNFEKALYLKVNPHPFIPSEDKQSKDKWCKEVLAIQTMGLMSRLDHIGCKHVVLGISGGLDSTLALMVAVQAFDRMGLDRKGIVAVTMPGYGTSGRTYDNATAMMKSFGVTMREVSIAAACDRHFLDIGHDKSVHDVTFENSQARERTQILMDIANQVNGIVVGTGDLSELALGWATYNGDHMSMYGVNASIPKTLAREVVRWAAEELFKDENYGGRSLREILIDVVETPVSPELLPPDENGEIAQVTEDNVGPYELHDFFLWQFMRFGYTPEKILFLAQRAFEGTYDRATIVKWFRKFTWRFFSQQFKRSCLPDGPKVGSVSLSPRGDWRMPSDASASIWINDIKE